MSTKYYRTGGFPGTLEFGQVKGFIREFIGFMTCPRLGQVTSQMDRPCNANMTCPNDL